MNLLCHTFELLQNMQELSFVRTIKDYLTVGKKERALIAHCTSSGIFCPYRIVADYATVRRLVIANNATTAV
jgi:hypothetical protein